MEPEEQHDAGTWKVPGKSFFTPLNVMVIIACCIPMVLTGSMLKRGARPPQVIKPAPDFNLINQRGERVATKDLLGKVWVGSFLFTHCPDVCPRTLQRLKGTKGWLEEKRPKHLQNFRFVGISLDAQGDTPETVERFLAGQGHVSKQWDYLMDSKSLHPLMRDGFLLGVREGTGGLAAAHSDRVVLVGKYGKIRGYYDLATNEVLAQMHGHIDLLVKESPSP